MRQWILRVTLISSLYFKWALEIPPGIQEMPKPGMKEKQSPLLLSRSQTPHEQYPEVPQIQNHNAETARKIPFPQVWELLLFMAGKILPLLLPSRAFH